MTPFLQSTIDPQTFTLGDWLKIAELRGFKPGWAFKSWIEDVSVDVLSALSLEDWEVIANALGLSEQWSYYQYKQYRITTKGAEVNGKA